MPGAVLKYIYLHNSSVKYPPFTDRETVVT